jgi:hypothetical protein
LSRATFIVFITVFLFLPTVPPGKKAQKKALLTALNQIERRFGKVPVEATGNHTE